MAKADLHVHSRFSSHPSEWFLQRIGASESYTEPEFIYRTAKERGMQFVTLTDHNTIEGALLLKERHPDDFFVSMEATTYFPKDQCKIHLLCYDISENEYENIQNLRPNIYDLRDYVRDNNIVHSVAHGTYSINNKLTPEHLEKLILLFDIFEIRNGARTRMNNEPWLKYLRKLDSGIIERLYDRHGIEPFSDTPWIKGFTGGSDDHAGIFIGKTYTEVEARSPKDFLDRIRQKQSISGGVYSNYRMLAFTIYKIAYEFSKNKSDRNSRSLFTNISEALFDPDSRSLLSRFNITSYKTFKGKSKNAVSDLYLDLYRELGESKSVPVEDKLDSFYDKLAVIADEFFRMLMDSLEKDFRKGDIVSIFRNISSSLPGIFLTIPFYSTLKHFYRQRNIVDELSARTGVKDISGGTKKILWFTDTLAYMNGVSMTVKKIGWLGYLKGRDISIVSAFPEEETPNDLPPNVINLPYIYEFSLPYYEHYAMRIPSMLRAVKEIYEYEPDEIYISTPGPVGLFGLLIGRLLNARCIGVYHTDFTMQVHELSDDVQVDNLVESYLKWFYSIVDENQVPTGEYISILKHRGYDASKMSIFKRGVDSRRFSPRPEGRDFLKSKYGVEGGITLMFAGRISRDKNISFLLEVFRRVRKRHGNVNLVICGDGPDLELLKTRHADDSSLIFTGRLDHDTLPLVYSGADVFVFPSKTDTFGKVVLEAQACGLPSIVSDIGGPKEIIVENETGFVALDSHLKIWEDTVMEIIGIIDNDPDQYKEMRRKSRENAVINFDWNRVIDNITMRQPAGEDIDSSISSETDRQPVGI